MFLRWLFSASLFIRAGNNLALAQNAQNLMFKGIAGIVGGLANMVAQSWFGEWIGWAISGFFSASIFLVVSLLIAPQRTNKLKSILSFIVVVLGAISAVGGFMSELQTSALAGVAMIMAAIGFWTQDVDEVIKKQI